MYASPQTARLVSRIYYYPLDLGHHMTREPRNQQEATPEFHRRPSSERALFPFPLRAADAKRSVKNILQWNSFLPTECVRIMVRMGWDYTT